MNGHKGQMEIMFSRILSFFYPSTIYMCVCVCDLHLVGGGGGGGWLVEVPNIHWFTAVFARRR